MPGKKALVLISKGNYTKVNGYLDRTLEQLERINDEGFVFDKTMENLIKDVIMGGVAFAKEHTCDFIVALGGGAVIDSSSAIAAMATNDGDLWDYVFGGTRIFGLSDNTIISFIIKKFQMTRRITFVLGCDLKYASSRKHNKGWEPDFGFPSHYYFLVFLT